MSENRILVIAKKETFLVRVLLEKIRKSGIDAVFCTPDINEINLGLEDVTFITLYVEQGEVPSEKILLYLREKLTYNDLQMILIAGDGDIRSIKSSIPENLIYRVFERPLDSEKYIETVIGLFEKIEAGEYKKSILIVDDDPSYLSLVRDWLKDVYRVSIVTSGLQAIKWLGRNKADAILLDYEMPVTSGPKVLEMLRADEETKSIPVIFLTGKGDRESVMSVVALKPEGYFLKNIDRQELLNNLEKFFAGRKANV
ncbi:MAG: response regulator [Lachnospiraceae bacterium]|nr:response regulator [Lachnospiraceae bacterium]